MNLLFLNRLDERDIDIFHRYQWKKKSRFRIQHWVQQPGQKFAAGCALTQGGLRRRAFCYGMIIISNILMAELRVSARLQYLLSYIVYKHVGHTSSLLSWQF